MDEEKDLFAEEEEESPPSYLRRLTLFKVIALVLVALIARQLWTLQVVDGSQYRQFADENRLRITTVKAPRGVIYDRDGQLLVRNVPSYTVGIVPASLSPDKEKDIFRLLGEMLTMSAIQVEEIYDEGRVKVGEFTPVPIKRNIPTETAFALEERHLDLPGVTVVVDPLREYREGPLTSHLIGYIGRISEEQYNARKDDLLRRYDVNDQLGQTGLEQIYEQELRGYPGEKLFEVDSSEREVSVVRPAEPKSGHNIVLSVDMDLQRAVTDIMSKYIKDYGAASAIVMDPNNGQILAMVDLPTYDNNLFTRGISQRELDQIMSTPYFPLINKSISSAFPPGSTFKMITSSSALQAGVVLPSTIVSCPGGMFVPGAYGGGAWFKCWGAHDTEDVISGLADSCDTYFYHLAGGEPHGKWPGLGPNRLADYARAFGLGARTGIDLPGEVTGLVPDPEWKKKEIGEPWYSGDTYIMGIGQSFLQVTPLQMLQVVSSIANGGTLYKPQLVMDVRDEEGNVVKPFQPQVIRELPIEKQWLAEVREGLRADMTYGTTKYGTEYWGGAWDSEVKEARMAGKTGTAESVINEKGVYDTHGWFAAFAPYENPRVAVVVFVQNGKGSQNAAPRVADIMRYIFGVPPVQGKP